MEKIRTKAEKIRNKFNYSNYSPINILNLAMRAIDNLTIVWMPMFDDVSGCCYKLEEDSLIFINSNHTKGRQNFTLAHEMYHLLYDYNGAIICTSKNNKEDIEKEADEFASSLLMPNIALDIYAEESEIESWNLKDIIKCEQYFQISHLTMLKRLRNKNLITDIEYSTFKKDIILNAKKLGFNSELYESSPDDRKYYSLGSLIPLVEEVFEMDKISKGKRNEILFDAFRGDIVFNLNQGGDDFE